MTELTTEQIIKGFWYWKPEQNFPPESITDIEQFKDKPILNLFITQTNKTAPEQKKLIDKWCQLLPNLTELKYIWFCSKVNDKIFEAACNIPNLEGLYIKWSGIKNISSISKLKKIKHLHIGSSSQIESIEPLRNIQTLITLNLEQLNKISDFSIISELHNLEGLGIDGSIWTTQKIDTLEPIESLSRLKYLTVYNSRIQDKSFDPILKLPNLIRFNSSWNYPESEFEKLKSIPSLKYGNIETSWKQLKEELNQKLKN